MTTYSYSRSYTLTIEAPPTIYLPQEEFSEKILVSNCFPIINKDDYRSIILDNAIVITELQIKVEVSFGDSDGVTASVSVYNLSKGNRDAITKVNGNIVLEAGYGGEEAIVFTGQVFRSEVRKEGEDIITVLKCKDGYTPDNGIRYTKSFPKDTQYSEIFEDMITEYGKNGISKSKEGIVLNEPNVVPWRFKDYLIPSEVKTVKTWSYTGYLKQALDSLCKEFNFTNQIIHSRLFILPENYPKMVGTVEVNPDNILSLKEAQDGLESSSTDIQPKGIELKLFLDGDIDPSKLIVITDEDSTGADFKDYVGNYKVSSMRHILDYEGDDWHTVVKCVGIKDKA